MLVTLPPKSSHFWCWWHCHQSQVTFDVGDIATKVKSLLMLVTLPPKSSHFWCWWHCHQSQVTFDVGDIATKVKSLLMLVTLPPKSLFDLESSALEDWILTLQNDIQIKSRSTSAQPGEHAVLWKILLAQKYHNLRRCTLTLDSSFWINLSLFSRTWKALGPSTEQWLITTL